MLTVTSGYKTANKSNVVRSNGKISVYDTVALTTKEFDNTKVGLIEITGTTFRDGRIIGNLSMHDIKIEMFGDTKVDFALNTEKHITPSFGMLVGGVYEWLAYQKFIVSSVEYDDTTRMTTIRGADFLWKSNVDFVDTNTYPMTLYNYLLSVGTYCGLDIDNLSIVNGSFSIESKPFQDFTPCSYIFSRIAELGGYFVRIKKSNDKLELVNAFPNTGYTYDELSYLTNDEIALLTYDELVGDSIETFTKDNYFQLWVKEHNFGINGVNTLVMEISQVVGENNSVENATNVAIDGAIEVKVVDNDIVNTETKRLAVINDLFDVVDRFYFIPFILDYIGYPYLEVGDVVTVTNNDGNTFVTVITDVMIKYDGGMKGQIRGQALNKTQTTYRNVTTAEKRLRTAEVNVDKVNAEVTILAGDYYDGKLEGAKYVFDGTNATFTNGGLIIKNALGETVFTADIDGNLDIIGKITATSGMIGRFEISGDDLVYTSDLFDKEYDYSDYIKLQRILAGLDTPTNYENEVYDLNNSGTVTITDLVILQDYLENGTPLPTPLNQIRSVIRMGTTSGEIKTTAVSALGNTGSTFSMKADKLTGDFLSVKTIGAEGGKIDLLDVINGVRFPATFVGSSDAKTLDDYYEGAWTPVLFGATSAGTGTYTAQVGTFTKIGNVVHFDIYLVWTAHTGTGQMKITLPFPSKVGVEYVVGVFPATLTFSNQLAGVILSGDDDISLFTFASNSARSVLNMDTSATLSISGTYRV